MPSAPALHHASASGRCCSRQRACCGTSSCSTNLRTVARKMASSSFMTAGSSVTDIDLLGQCSDKPGGGRKARHAPAAVLAGCVRDAEDARGLTGGKRHREAIEGVRKPFAQRLDERFLARPALEEAERPLARIERAVRLVLHAGKKARR